MFSSFSNFINFMDAVLFFVAPLAIQLVLFPIAKLIFRKTPSHALYTVCLIINTFLLFLIKQDFLNSLTYEEPFDAFDSLIISIMWAPYYIGIVISCIVRTAKASKKENTDEEKENVDCEINSD